MTAAAIAAELQLQTPPVGAGGPLWGWKKRGAAGDDGGSEDVDSVDIQLMRIHAQNMAADDLQSVDLFSHSELDSNFDAASMMGDGGVLSDPLAGLGSLLRRGGSGAAGGRGAPAGGAAAGRGLKPSKQGAAGWQQQQPSRLMRASGPAAAKAGGGGAAVGGSKHVQHMLDALGPRDATTHHQGAALSPSQPPPPLEQQQQQQEKEQQQQQAEKARKSRASSLASMRQAKPMVLSLEDLAGSTPEVLEWELQHMSIDELLRLGQKVGVA
jgi:hypothetical protein